MDERLRARIKQQGVQVKVADVPQLVLADALRAGRSWADVKRACGIGGGGAVHRALRRRVAELGLPAEHLFERRRVVSDTRLAALVCEADSTADVLRALGMPQAGGSHAHLARRIRALGLDTGHFTRRRRAAAGRRSALTPEAVLVRRPDAERRRPAGVLTSALVAVGRAHACEGCGTGPSWRGRRLVLHVDHVDGDWRDDREANLRFLCPNCHSQTPTYCRRPADRHRARGGTRTPTPEGGGT